MAPKVRKCLFDTTETTCFERNKTSIIYVCDVAVMSLTKNNIITKRALLFLPARGLKILGRSSVLSKLLSHLIVIDLI